MGNRIHRCIGWGTDSAKQHWTDKDKLSELVNEYWNIQEFGEWCETNWEDIKNFHLELNKYVPHKDDPYFVTISNIASSWNSSWGEPDKKWCIHECFNTSGHDYPPQRMLFTPIGASEDWRRHDSIIDYYEAGQCANDKMKFLKTSQGIYPYTGMIPLVEIPKDYRIHGHNPLSPSEYSMLVGYWSKKAKPIANGAELESLLNDWIPQIPVNVSCLVWYLKDVIKDPMVFLKSLRPAIYTYWC